MSKRRDRSDLLICLFIVVVTLAVYWQVGGFDFVTIDDLSYVRDNPHVTGGLTPAAVKWAFATNYQSNWHPLTWLSLMVDGQACRANPSLYHLTNVLLHVLNALLVFVVFRRMTGFRWRSAAVAVLFALHPLHVESVAWVTERKDVLSTFFWLLTMLAYLGYVARRSVVRYVSVVMAFALGLMAKPMLVTLPIVLLLMDVWPLGRVRRRVESGEWSGQPPVRTVPCSLSTLFLEKLPLFALAAASCVVTFWAQSAGQSVAGGEVYGFGVRLANAFVACVGYIVKMVYPLDLAVLYPHPGISLPVWQVVGAAVLIVATTVVAARTVRSRPYVAFGWLWYLITLLPVIGLVQVGQQAMADRYTYVPLIGLFVILAWGVPDLLAKLGQTKPSVAVYALGGVVLVGLIANTYMQIGYWRNGVTLFEHAVAVDDCNYLAHTGLGNALAEVGRSKQAIEELERALEIRPDFAQAHYNLGLALAETGRLPEAVTHYTAALKSMPDSADVHNNLGAALAQTGQVDEAIDHFRTAAKLRPDDSDTLTNLGCAYAQKGEMDSAVAQFEAALELDASNERAREYLKAAESLLRRAPH